MVRVDRKTAAFQHVPEMSDAGEACEELPIEGGVLKNLKTSSSPYLGLDTYSTCQKRPEISRETLRLKYADEKSIYILLAGVPLLHAYLKGPSRSLYLAKCSMAG